MQKTIRNKLSLFSVFWLRKLESKSIQKLNEPIRKVSDAIWKVKTDHYLRVSVLVVHIAYCESYIMPLLTFRIDSKSVRWKKLSKVYISFKERSSATKLSIYSSTVSLIFSLLLRGSHSGKSLEFRTSRYKEIPSFVKYTCCSSTGFIFITPGTRVRKTSIFRLPVHNKCWKVFL